MEISKATKHFFKLLQQWKLFFVSWLHSFWFIVAASPDNADQADKEEEPGHEEWTKSKVEAANIQGLHNVNFPNEGHDHGVREEKEYYFLEFLELLFIKVFYWILNAFTYLRPKHPVVVQSIKDVVDTNGTANRSIETENKEELLIFPANTVTKKETMMVKNIDASPKKTDLTWRKRFKSEPAVGTVVRSKRNM